MTSEKLDRLKKLWSNYYLLILIIAVTIISSFLHPSFFTGNNLANVFGSNVTTALVSIGMFAVILTGGIDLSVGPVVALSSSLLAGFLTAGYPAWLSILIIIIAMIIPGLISGVLVAYAKITPIMATLAMSTIIRGIAYIYATGSSRIISNRAVLYLGSGKILGIPVPLIILLIYFIPCWILFNKTKIGRELYAMGGNETAAFLSGVSVKRNLVLAYSFSSFTAGVTGIVLAGRLMMGAPIFGEGYEMDAIASIVIGGASLSGGSGLVRNVVLGAFVLGLITNILNLLGLSSYFQMVVKGLIILSAVLGGYFLNKNKAG